MIRIFAFNKEWDFDIVEVKPLSTSKCVRLIDVNVNIDFAEPLDYINEDLKIVK